MRNKNMIMIIGLLFLVLLSVSFVSANENVTEITQNNDENIIDEAIADNIEANPTNEDIQQTNEIIGATENQYNAIISAEDFTATYNSGKSINVKVKDLNGNPIEYAIVKIVYSKSKNEDMDMYIAEQDEANKKIDEILQDKVEFEINVLDIESEIENTINDLSDVDVRKIDLLMFMNVTD